MQTKNNTAGLENKPPVKNIDNQQKYKNNPLNSCSKTPGTKNANRLTHHVQVNTLASSCFRRFSEKKRLNARGFAQEYLRSCLGYGPGWSVKRRGKSSSLHSKKHFLLGGCGFFYEWRHKWRPFRPPWPTLPSPGRQLLCVSISLNKPIDLWRYVDDIFVAFNDMNALDIFFNTLNSVHNNITFTTELECGDSLAFLDVLIEKT